MSHILCSTCVPIVVGSLPAFLDDDDDDDDDDDVKRGWWRCFVSTQMPALDASAGDLDSSACETADEVAGGGSVSNDSVLPASLGNDRLVDSLLRDNSASSDVEDTSEEKKDGLCSSHVVSAWLLVRPRAFCLRVWSVQCMLRIQVNG